MKTKIKRHSRAVMSVVLSVCILISCMTVGLIATDAAYDDSEAVGDDITSAIVKGSWDWGDAKDCNNKFASFTLPANTTYSFVFQVDSEEYTAATTISSTTDYNFSKQNGSITLRTAAAGTYKFKVKSKDSGSISTRIEFPELPKVCTSLDLSASPSSLSSTTDTFTLTATATSPVSGTITYKFYDGSNTLLDTQTSSNGTATSTALTQADKRVKNYYVTAEMSEHASVSSSQISVKNTAIINTDAVYVYGEKFGKWSNWSTSDIIAMTIDSATGYYYVDHTVDNSGDSNHKDRFRIYDNTTNKHYKPEPSTNLVLDGAKVTATEGWSENYFGLDDIASETEVRVWFDLDEKKVWVTSGARYTLELQSNIANATVTATYGGNTIGEGGSISDIPVGASIAVTVVPDVHGKTCTGITSSPQATYTPDSGKNFTLSMPDGNTTISAVSIGNVPTKRIYFNNYYTRYAMVSAYATYEDGTEALGKWSGQTMTRIDNTNTWYVDVPGDVDYVTFIGDNNANTGQMEIPWDDYTAPKYTAPALHNDEPTPENGGTWGEYVARSNETTVTDGTTFSTEANKSKLYTGISATMYDYFVDNELTGGWISGIGSRDYSHSNGDDYDWNPYRHFDHAISAHASQEWNDVWRPLYFGNLNTVNGSTKKLDKDTLISGDPQYTGWNLNANNSINLSPNSKAIMGLSGDTLANSTIHYAESDGTNGADMAMFDEDFLSGENDKGEVLAQILRVSSFPIRKETISSKPTEVYLDTSGFEAWEGNSAVMRAVFFNNNTSEATRTLVTATKVADHFYKVTIPSGYSKVQWWRANPSNLTQAWNWGNEVAIPTDNNNVSKITGWSNSETWGTDARTTPLGSHVYYQFNSQYGTDNAYITNISGDKKTATIDYYSSSDGKKVKSCGNNVGFFPFDFDQAGSDAGLAHDLGFGMKLEIPFTLEKNGEFEDGTHQEFDFSGDDDLWVYVDGKLVLDLGGAHARTEGHIDFADKTVTYTSASLTDDSTATRNGSFTIDNTNTNQVHTMTIYYMERGMYDSNLMFGFSFHAIDNQLKTEKKVRTANINSGFYVMNDTTKSGVYVDDGSREVTKFEATYQNEDFIVTHEYKSSGASDYSLAAGKKYTIGSAATQTIGADGTYKLKNDDIAYFVGEFTSGDSIRLRESPDSTNLYNYDQSIKVYDDANNSKEVTGTGNATDGYAFTFSPTTTAVTDLEILNLRARFTNQMRQHDLIIEKQTQVEDTETNFKFRIKFKFGDYDYTAYPLYCIIENATTGARISTGNLSAGGEITIKAGQRIDIPKIPENALIQVEEVDIDSTYDISSIVVTDSDSAAVTKTDITNGVQFEMGEKNINALVTNSKFSGFTVSKELKYSPATDEYVDYPDNTSKFRIKVESGADGSTWSALASKAFTSSDGSRTDPLTTDANGIAVIKRGEKLSFSDIAVNSYIRVTEDTQESTYSGEIVTDAHMPLDYQYKSAAAKVGSSDATALTSVTDGYYKGCSFQIASGRVDVTITNMKPRYRWISNFNYESRSTNLGNSSLWGELSYQSKGVFTADELIKYTKFDIVTFTDDSTGRGIVFKSTELKSEFLTKKAPYVDNFRQTLGWNYDRANVDNIYDAEAGIELSLTPASTNEAADALTVVYYFPNQMKWINSSTELVVDDSEGYMYEPGVPKANIAADGTPGNGDYSHSERKNKTVKYADWYTTNNVHVKDGAATAKFVTAPQKVWDVDAGKYKYFQYWSVRTLTNDSSDSVEFSRCYNNAYNFVFYQDSYVYAVYGENQTNMYDLARQTENHANLTFLENSRNQWNQPSSAAEATYGPGKAYYGDRLFSDFVVDLHYSKQTLVTPATESTPAVYDVKNIQLNQISAADKANYQAGVLIETVRDLNSSEVDTEKGKMLVTDKEIAAKYRAVDNLNAKNDAIDYLYGTLFNSEAQNKAKYLTSGIDVTSFDNKNQMEYAYSFANISQTADYRTETTRKMKLYRAYSYLIDNSDPTNPVKIISDPVYFTIYDMASIINDYDKEVTITG